MTAEGEIKGFAKVQIEGGREIMAKIISGRISFVNKKGQEIKPLRKLKVPEGTIKSLRPLLQEAFGLFGVDQGDGHWEKVAQEAPFSPRRACNKLKRAGINHVEATRLLIQDEPRIQEALSHGDISDNTLESFVSLVAASVHLKYIGK